MSENSMGDEVYQPDRSEVQDDEGLLEPEDTLIDRGVAQVLDEGYSPPERPRGVESFGTTAEEQRHGESLDQRLTQEVPDSEVPPGDELGDTSDTDGELVDQEVGDRRAGRLVAPDEGTPRRRSVDMLARDAGVDGAGASAEEAAVHVVPDPEETDEQGGTGPA